MKRFVDIVLALAGVIVLSPLTLITALLVRLKIGKPILFIQQRPGLYGRPFNIYKFRTMLDAKDSSGELASDEQRLTRFGKVLRSTSLDELPELFNVLRGDMSIVGPRPLLMEYLPLYTAEQARRHEVRPGITGWAQVNGRNSVEWEDRLAMDVWYVDNRSIFLDLRILFMTVIQVFARKGITAKGHVTMEKFRGE